jgi:hypothetical protein
MIGSIFMLAVAAYLWHLGRECHKIAGRGSALAPTHTTHTTHTPEHRPRRALSPRQRGHPDPSRHTPPRAPSLTGTSKSGLRRGRLQVELLLRPRWAGRATAARPLPGISR